MKYQNLTGKTESIAEYHPPRDNKKAWAKVTVASDKNEIWEVLFFDELAYRMAQKLTYIGIRVICAGNRVADENKFYADIVKTPELLDRPRTIVKAQIKRLPNSLTEDGKLKIDVIMDYYGAENITKELIERYGADIGKMKDQSFKFNYNKWLNDKLEGIPKDDKQELF